ncbi:hypothetical protein Tco_0448766 [Tanacetum coccineum]
MQDKNIAISELKKLIENCKGKSVETQFNKPSVVRQPNAQRIPKPSVLGKPTPFSNSPEMRSFQTKQSVNKTNVSDGLWVPTGKLLNSCTGKVENEPTHGSNVDIPHIHACKQTLGLSAGTSFNGQKQQRIDLNADALYNEKQENLRVWPRSSMFERRLIASDQASVFMSMMSIYISSGLVLHQMTSDITDPELGIFKTTQ